MANTTRRSRIKCVTGSRTLAEVKAGSQILPGFAGSYIITGGWLRCVGGDAAGADSINISDTAGTPVVGVAIAAGPLDDGVINRFDAAANTTRTTFGQSLTYGKGLQIVDAGAGALSGPTTVDFCVMYQTVSG
jgi:hypothetical protein